MQKRVLVCPLDWGLGHATRCIPVIDALLRKGCHVEIAGSGRSLSLLKSEFAELTTHELVSYQVDFDTRLPLTLYLLSKFPRVSKIIETEHQQVNKIIGGGTYDLIISDNRYGCYSTKVRSVLITHQLSLQIPPALSWLRGVGNRYVRKAVEHFDRCWVPDFPDNLLSGVLSHSAYLKPEYIGTLSRFKPSGTTTPAFAVVAVISGPEPQRSNLEALLRAQLTDSGLKYALVRGLPDSSKACASNEFNHLPAIELQKLIESAACVIARSGYSTIMDLATLKKKAILIPTPGQTEQEYLAKVASDHQWCVVMSQKEFNLDRAMKQLPSIVGFPEIPQLNLFDVAIENILKA